MNFFNAVYPTFKRQQPIEIRSVKIEESGRCAQVTSWIKWVVTFPVAFPVKAVHNIYNLYKVCRYKEKFHELMADQIDRDKSVHEMLSSLDIVTSDKIYKKIFAHYRNDLNGFFQVREGDNGEFISIINDIISLNDSSLTTDNTILGRIRSYFLRKKVQKANVKILRNAFLLTCPSDRVKALRAPFQAFINSSIHLNGALKHVKGSFFQWLSKKETLGSIHISASKLSDAFVVSVVNRLFFDRTMNFKYFQRVASAIKFVINFQGQGMPKKQRAQYEEELEVIKSAIVADNGEFQKYLEDSGLDPMQIKVTLLIAYLAGVETTSSTLKYILWRLGQHLKRQEQIVRELNSGQQDGLMKFVNECLRMYTPIFVLSRTARRNLEISVEYMDGRVWKYPIWKGTTLMWSPHIAGRDEHNFVSPNDFKPDRFDDIKNPHPTMLFGGGPHACPGMRLAKETMISFLTPLLKRYVITSSPDKLSMKVAMFLKINEDVKLVLRKR